MSKGNVDKFLDLMQKDESLARKMAACLYKLETNDGKAEGSGDFIARDIVPLAKEYGFEFTEQDFLDYTNEATAKAGLSAEDLADVSGGKGGVRAALMGTLALLGVAAAPAAMDMLSGGEVAPFSMVASAAGEDLDDESFNQILDNVLTSADDVLKSGDINAIGEKISVIDQLLKDFPKSNAGGEKVNARKAELEKKKAELEKKAAQSLATQMKAKIDNVEEQLREVKAETKTELETKLEEALKQATPAYDALADALEGDDAEKISAALKDARTQYDAFTGAIKTYLEGLKAEVEEALQTEDSADRECVVKDKNKLRDGWGSDKTSMEKGSIPNNLDYIKDSIALIKEAKESYDKLDELKELIVEKKEQLGANSPIIAAAEAQERQLREKLNKVGIYDERASYGKQAEAEINKINDAVDALKALNDAKAAAKEPMEKLAQAITDAKGLSGQALTAATNLKTELDKAKTAEDFKTAVGQIEGTIQALEKAVPTILATNMKAKIDNVATELGNVKLEEKTELETKLEEALKQATPAYEALAAALEGNNAEKISDALKDARTQYDAFTGAIKTYLEGLKAEVEEALQTEANENRPYLVKIKETLQNDTRVFHDIDKQLKEGQLDFIQYIRVDLANMKTVKASYDKLDELKALIEEKKEQLGEDSSIITAAKEQESQLREKLDSEMYTAGLATWCVVKVKEEINMINAAVAAKEPMAKLAQAIIDAAGRGGQALADAKKLQEKLETALKGSDAKAINDAVAKIENTIEKLNAAVALHKAKENAKRPLETLEEAIASAAAAGSQALKDAIKLKNDLEEALKGTDANAINDAIAKIDETIKALNKAKLAELPTKAPTILQGLNDKLNVLENMAKMQNRTAVQETINELRNRIKKIGTVTNKNAAEKAEELDGILERLRDLTDSVYDFEADLYEHKNNIKSIENMLVSFKDEAEKADNQADVEEIEKLEQELAAIPEQSTSSEELDENIDKLNAIWERIPQINAALNKATRLKEIAEQVDVSFVETFDNIIKEIEAADSVEKINLAKEKLNANEQVLVEIMKEKINEANKTAHILYEIAKIFGLNQLKGNFLNLIDTFDSFNYEGAPTVELHRVYQEVEKSVSAAEKNLKEWMGEQIDTLKEQATKLKDMATGVSYDDFRIPFEMILADINAFDSDNISEENSQTLNKIRWRLNGSAKKFASKEIDELLTNNELGAEIQAELKAIKAGLPKADEANADTVVKAFDAVKAVKTKMANKLLEWHKLLNEYHNKGYHKDGVEAEVVEVNLDQLHNLANQMLDGKDGIKLDAETLNAATALAIEIAGNLKTDIGSIADAVRGYDGFAATDITAGIQAKTLVTFLRNNFDIVDDLKFVDKETRAKLAKDIKHIFEQIKIDQKTGEYKLQGKLLKADVAHNDLKLICEAYDVVAEDLVERTSYKPFVEGTTETTNGWSFRSMLSSFTGAKEQSQLINKTTHLINELKKVSRLDLLDVSPESRVALKNDIMEISAQIKSRAHSWRFNKLYYYFSGISDSQTNNMQDGLARILEFYKYIYA